MGDAGYRGVSAEQDGRYRNKETLLLKKLAADGQFPPHYDQKVDMTKVNLDVMRPWVAERVEALLGFEDDVVVEYVNGMLEDPENKQPDPRKMQLSLTGFLEKSTPVFMGELWTLLLSAQKSIGGIPQEFVDKKKEEMRLARERDAQAIASSRAGGYGQRPQRGQQQDYVRGAPRGNDRGERRMRDSRWENHQDRNRSSGYFKDKSGNQTERVQDSGWGARAGPSRRRDDEYGRDDRRRGGRYESREDRDRGIDKRYDERRQYEERLSPPPPRDRDYDGHQSRYAERNQYNDKVHSRRRSPSRSPSRSPGANRHRSYRRRSPSYSPPPPPPPPRRSRSTRGRSPSRTPELDRPRRRRPASRDSRLSDDDEERGTSHRRRRSRESISPSRSPSYSPSLPSPRHRQGRRDRDRLASPSPPRRRAAHDSPPGKSSEMAEKIVASTRKKSRWHE